MSCDVIAVGVDSGRIIIGTLLVVVVVVFLVFAVAKLGRPESQNESHSSDDDHALGR